jgi:glucosamine kinase
VTAASRAVLGLDIGGSSSRARLSEGGRILAEAEGPGANVATIGPALVERRISALLSELGPVQPVACCAGSAGAEVPAARRRLEVLLTRLLPGCRVAVVHDTRLVIAAAGLDAGIALISGTGSVAYGRDHEGREARAGGWGWLIGDDGSGVWVVREAAREVMRRVDAGEPAGALGDALLTATHARGVRELIGKLHSLREARRWAELAGPVFEAAAIDAGARDVVARAAEALAGLAETIRERLSLEGPVILAGGLLLNQPWLEAAVRERLGAGVSRLEAPPVAGAVSLAESSSLI